MGDILDLIFEIILEGAVEALGCKKVPMLWRVLLAGVLAAFFGGLLGLMFFIGIQRGNILLLIMSPVLFAGLAVLVVLKVKRHRKAK